MDWACLNRAESVMNTMLVSRPNPNSMVIKTKQNTNLTFKAYGYVQENR